MLAGTLGSWFGATLMYWASRLAGRPLVLHFGKYFFISTYKVEGAERWAAHYGAMGIFISRLLPVVRHLIGIPAGIVRMDYLKFSLFTLLGSGIWCSVLCWLGVKMGQDEQLMKGEYHRVTLWLAGAMLVLGGLYYFFVHRHMREKSGVQSPKSKVRIKSGALVVPHARDQPQPSLIPAAEFCDTAALRFASVAAPGSYLMSWKLNGYL